MKRFNTASGKSFLKPTYFGERTYLDPYRFQDRHLFLMDYLRDFFWQIENATFRIRRAGEMGLWRDFNYFLRPKAIELMKPLRSPNHRSKFQYGYYMDKVFEEKYLPRLPQCSTVGTVYWSVWEFVRFLWSIEWHFGDGWIMYLPFSIHIWIKM